MTELAPLVGTDKQIAWAEDIRRQTWARLDDIDTVAHADGTAMVTAARTARDYLAGITSAKQWIDARKHLTEGWISAGVTAIAGRFELGQWARAHGVRAPKLTSHIENAARSARDELEA